MKNSLVRAYGCTLTAGFAPGWALGDLTPRSARHARPQGRRYVRRRVAHQLGEMADPLTALDAVQRATGPDAEQGGRQADRRQGLADRFPALLVGAEVQRVAVPGIVTGGLAGGGAPQPQPLAVQVE